MQQEAMDSHQQLLSSRSGVAQSETGLARSSSFPQQNSNFVAQQPPAAGKQNYQGYSSGRRNRGDPAKPGLRGGPQKVSKTNKKDAKARGQGGDGWNVQAYHEVTQDRGYELELNLAQGRKVSLNHLLNFTFERRGEQQPTRGGRKYSGQGQHHHHQPRLPKYNKDQFLQANCQFVVKHDADYSVYLADPDLLVDWTLIEQIRLRGPEVGSCPICLHPPVAAKMTRCGHIYCWPCVLHYLALSDRAWRACPVCSDPIYRKDLKSVISIPQKQYQIGEEIEFRLMRRERDSLLPHFVSQPPGDELGNIRNERGQKLVLASPLDVAEFVLRREKVELDTQYECEKEQPESCFILEALTLLKDRENQQAASYEEVDPCTEISLSDIGKEQLDDSLLGVEGDHDESVDRSRYDSVSSDQMTDHSKDEVSGTGTVTSIGPEDLEFHENEPEKVDVAETSAGAKKDVFYFYQAADGQNIYLHGLNAQMLIHEYGSLERAPRILRGTIIERDSMTMSHDLRNRLRYLRHLPVTTYFDVIEIDLGVPIVSRKTVAFFHDRLAERERRRRRKDRDERRRERRIQVEEEAKMGRFPKLNVKLDSSLHFPECTRDNYHPDTESDPVLVPESAALEEHFYDSPLSGSPARGAWTAGSPSGGAWGAATSSSGGMSFAQTLRSGKLKPSPSWPVVRRDPVTVQPKKKIFDPDDDEPPGVGIEYQAPAAMSLSAALSAALDQASRESSSRAGTEASAGNGSKKKKNKSKKVLFSTGL